jgi:DUF4097 and DUF4098 domain-containing protein YvlB
MKKITVLVFSMLLALPAWAATVSVDETRKAAPDADVQIELIAGKVRVEGWDRDEVRVRGTVNEKWETVEIGGDADDISIEVKLPRGSNRNVDLEADLEIHVPTGVELTFETVSAPLTVDGLTASISVESISGGIEIRGDPEELSIESISGKVDIDAGPALNSVDVETVSGNVEMRGDLSPSGDYSFSTVSGGITLRVPAGASADYEIETFSGRIVNDFGPEPEKASFLPAKSLSFSVGSGSADVEISAVSGSIRLIGK